MEASLPSMKEKLSNFSEKGKQKEEKVHLILAQSTA
jgi:hypothetical protein